MSRYAAFSALSASTLLLLLCNCALPLSAAAQGNIGCLFSETLCNQEKEWCFDDYAFGRCLTLYGNVHEEDMHRYKLGTSELHLLEQEMQRLFLLGYRWSHTYTQCVLQALLTSIRDGHTNFDVSSCNAELDQDLEGALKAIEGEEDHIDPQNLAVVRFSPSVVDPHSEYADEFYFPPMEELMPPVKGENGPLGAPDEDGPKVNEMGPNLIREDGQTSSKDTKETHPKSFTDNLGATIDKSDLNQILNSNNIHRTSDSNNILNVPDTQHFNDIYYPSEGQMPSITELRHLTDSDKSTLTGIHHVPLNDIPNNSDLRHLNDVNIPLNSDLRHLNDANIPLNSDLRHLNNANIPLNSDLRHLNNVNVPLNSDLRHLNDASMPLNPDLQQMNVIEIPRDMDLSHLNDVNAPVNSDIGHINNMNIPNYADFRHLNDINQHYNPDIENLLENNMIYPTDAKMSPEDVNAALKEEMAYPRTGYEDNFEDDWNYEDNYVPYEITRDNSGVHRFKDDFDYEIGYNQRFMPSYKKRSFGYADDMTGYQMDGPALNAEMEEVVGRKYKNPGLREFAKKLASIRKFDELSPKAQRFDSIRETVFFPEGKERIFPPRHQRVREPDKEDFYEGVVRLKSDPSKYYYRDKEIYVKPKEPFNNNINNKPKTEFSNPYMNNYINSQPKQSVEPEPEQDTTRGIPVLEAPQEGDDHPDTVHPQYKTAAEYNLKHSTKHPHQDTFLTGREEDNRYRLYNTDGDYLQKSKVQPDSTHNSPSKFTEENMLNNMNMINGGPPPPDYWESGSVGEAYPGYQKQSPNQYKSTSFESPILDGSMDPYPPSYAFSFYGDYSPDYGGIPPDYYDYGTGSGRGYMPPNADPWYNTQRGERLDVKKPGPFFRSDNNFAFDYENDQRIPYYPTGDWMPNVHGPMNYQSDMTGRMPQGYHPNQHVQNNNGHGKHHLIPDLLLTDEGLVESLSERDRSQNRPGEPKVSHQVAPQETKPLDNKINPDDKYVYISIGGSFNSPKEGHQLVDLLLTLIKADKTFAEDIRVKESQVRFKVKENNVGLTAAKLAEQAQELSETIRRKTEIDIIQSGVGTETTMRAVVYSSNKYQMMAVIAIVLGVCGALLTAAVILFFLKKNSRSKAKLQGLGQDTESSKDYQDLCRARMSSGKDAQGGKEAAGQTQPSSTNGRGPGQRISSLSKDSDNGVNSPSSRSSTSSWSEEPVVSNMDISTGHMVLSYMEDHLKNKDRLDKEWTSLCSYEAEPCASNVAKKPENLRKNRYSECVPYDHNRVILNEHTNVSRSNYVNASSITDHDPRNPAYIATQGPLASTAADFWQLVWEQGSVVIVMVTRLSENGMALCHRYWPEEGSELYHIYEVHLVSEHTWCDDYLVRSFYLKNLKTGETRTVTQFHFLSWPEVGVPTSTKAMLEFRRKVNKSYRGRSCPIIVHCSDGVGRSGTYCLIDMVLNRMAKGAKEIDIAATLEHIRDQRPNMVKTKIQFEFVLMAVAEEVHAILKALPQ